jgi:phage major head subunit gpT-like protein
MIIDSANLTALKEAINKRFQAGFTTASVFWPELAMLVPSTTAIETYAWLADIPGFREWVGERVVHNLKSRGAKVENKKYEDTIEIPREKLEDDQYGIYGVYAEMMGAAARKLPDQLLAAILKAGNATTIWDGQFFFDTDHPVNPDDPSSPVQVNRFTTKPLNAANYAEVRAAMLSYVGEGGRSMAVTPNMICVPPQLERTAKEIVAGEIIPSAAGTASQSNVFKGTATVHVVPELASEATVWYLCDTTKPVKPFVWQERTPVEFTPKFNPGDDNVFCQDKYLFGGRIRGAATYGLWFLAARCEG